MKRAAVIRAAPRIADLDRAANQALAQKSCSAVGMAFLTLDKARRLVPRHLASYGFASPPPPPVRLAPSCCFDLGLLTGGLVPTLIAMQWTAKGRIDLQRPLGAVLPEASRGPLAAIPLSTLLDHTSGIGPQTEALAALLARCPRPPRASVRSASEPAAAPALAPLRTASPQAVANLGGPLEAGAKQALVQGICTLTPVAKPGEQEAYSPVNLLLLGWVLEAIGGKPLDQLFSRDVAAPLRVSPEVQYVRCGPHGPWQKEKDRAGEAGAVQTAACSFRRRLPQGEPAELLTYLLGGVAGHNGLFSSLGGLVLLTGPLLLAAAGAPSPLHQGSLARFFSRSKRTDDARFALGWETACRDNGMAPGRWHPRSVGLICPSGQSVFIDPAFGVLGILVTNWGHGGVRPPGSGPAASPAASFEKFRLRVFDIMAGLT